MGGVCFRNWLLVSAVVSLSACGGGSGAPALAPAVAPTSASALAPTSFVLSGASAAAASHRPAYVSSNVKSVAIVLVSVNGSPPPAGLSTTTTDNVTIANCPCTIAGPTVPLGNDQFTMESFKAHASAKTGWDNGPREGHLWYCTKEYVVHVAIQEVEADQDGHNKGSVNVRVLAVAR